MLVFPEFLFSPAGLFSPNFLHLLPDGFREGKVFVLDVFHCHHPPITATQTRPLSLLSSQEIKIIIMFLYIVHIMLYYAIFIILVLSIWTPYIMSYYI